MMRVFFALVLLSLSACSTSSQVSPNLPRGEAAYGVVPPAAPDRSQPDYKINPLDTVDVSIYGEPDLSVKGVQVDTSGTLSLPLIGAVPVAGKTATELSQFLQDRLGQKYLRNPQVTVTVANSGSQKVSVQGEVAQPGVYDIKGPTTLLETLAMAKGELRSASLDQVVVFRTIEGKRMGAVFDIKAIRAGSANDPQILGNDVVVVGFSQARRTWDDILKALPIFNVFRPFTY